MSTVGIAQGAARDVETVVLDALFQSILKRGITKTTLSEVARVAGVSRPTVYRRWSDLNAMTAALLTREVGGVVGSVTRPSEDLDGLVFHVVEVARRLASHELMRVLRRTDHEQLGIYVFTRLGTAQYAILDIIRQSLETCRAASGTIRDGDSRRMAAVVLLMTQSAVLSAEMIQGELPEDALFEELAIGLRGYLGA